MLDGDRESGHPGLFPSSAHTAFYLPHRCPHGPCLGPRLDQSSVLPLRGQKAFLPPSGCHHGQPGPRLPASAALVTPAGSSADAVHPVRPGLVAHSPPVSSSGSQLPVFLPRGRAEGSGPLDSLDSLYLSLLPRLPFEGLPLFKAPQFWAEGLGFNLSDSADLHPGLLFL